MSKSERNPKFDCRNFAMKKEMARLERETERGVGALKR